MKTESRWKLVSVIASLNLVLIGFAMAEEIQMFIPPGNFARQLGSAALSDPSGATHTKQEVAGKVVVAIFSAPNMSQADAQKEWSRILADQPATKVSDQVKLVLVEDMSQSGIFKGMALSSMKKHFTKDSRPFLIIDQSGSELKKFGVPRGTTEILIYDKKGVLRDVENDLNDEAESVKRIKFITAKLMAE
jgi:hypothetical protein